VQETLTVLGNFLIILFSILVFSSPFYYLYRRQGHGTIKSHGINREIAGFLQSKQADYLIFFWAMANALFWFIIPEFLLLLIIFMRTKHRRELLIYNIFGTVAGTVLAFAINLPDYLIEKLPYIQPAMTGQVATWFDKSGIFALIHQPFSGVPYEVFAYLGPNYHILIIVFIIVAVLVSLARYFIVYFVLNLIYPLLHRYVYRNYVYLFLVVVFIFSLLFIQVYNSYDSSYTISVGGQNTVAIRKVSAGWW
jgi:hypothetical protein